MTIPYEICAKLKRCGFPFKKPFTEVGIPALDDAAEAMGQTFVRFDGEWYLMPTLEELIDELKEKFYALTYINDERGVWCAHDNRIVKEGWGDTPLIAVCNLWLALHKVTSNQ
jgi:hypothetical protein